METINTDVLVIGAGAAGIRAALAASETGANVLMLAKGPIAESGSTFSTMTQGWGIQALVGDERTEKNLQDFYEDIMRTGLGRCDPKLVRILVEESGPRLEDLISYGIRFRKNPDQSFLRVKGCFSDHERAFVTEDIRNIKQSFPSIIQQSSVKILSGYAEDLIIAEGACWGAWTHTADHKVKINAKATILAAGGGAGIFKEHLVSDEQVGDGYILAHRAGTALKNLEFIQWMLGLKKDGARLFLPLTALGKSARMLDEKGRDLLEIRIPDPIARQQAVKDRQRHFPFSCRDSSYQVDIAVAGQRQLGKKVFWDADPPEKEPAEVLHFSHAFNGGIAINESAESSVPGLFAAGEVASGPHGADRIGGCMMTATQVFGARAGKFAALRAKTIRTIPNIRKPTSILLNENSSKDFIDCLDRIRNKAKDLYAEHLTILRNEPGLIRCLERINHLQLEFEAVGGCSQQDLKPYLELRSILELGKLVAESALKNKDCQGSHFRTDAPIQ